MGIMDGVRVLEVAAWTYVPSAGAVLAEWGADVIKIEHPESGDPQRGLVSSGLVPSGPGGVNHMIELPNRGKRSGGDRPAHRRGPRPPDAVGGRERRVPHQLPPPARKALRLEVEEVRAANPDIVYVRGSRPGAAGPEADRGGYDGCSFWARAWPTSRRRPGWSGWSTGPAFGDLIGGAMIAGGICAALYHRERTGEALVVDNSLATALWATSASVLAAGLFGLGKMPSFDRREVPNPIVNTYRTSDGRFLSLIMLQADR